MRTILVLYLIEDKKEQTCFRTLLFAQATGRHSDAPPWFNPLVVASYIGILKLYLYHTEGHCKNQSLILRLCVQFVNQCH